MCTWLKKMKVNRLKESYKVKKQQRATVRYVQYINRPTNTRKTQNILLLMYQDEHLVAVITDIVYSNMTKHPSIHPSILFLLCSLVHLNATS